MYLQTILLIIHMYIKIHSHQHKITPLILIHLVHTCNKYAFGIVIFEPCYMYHPVGKFTIIFLIINHAIHLPLQS